MKKLLTFMVGIVFCLNTVVAQEYVPFYMDNARWVMKRTMPVLGAYDNYDYWEVYTLNDTIIENLVYHKVATRNLCIYRTTGYGDDRTLELHTDIYSDEFILGGIREEDKMVYFRRFDTNPDSSLLQFQVTSFDNSEDYLLYDFNAEVGDTINYKTIEFTTAIDGDTSYHSKSYFSIVKKINERIDKPKEYIVSNSAAYLFPDETTVITEGIGSDYGIFGSYDSYLTQLICFTVDGETVKYGLQCDPCMEVSSSIDQNNKVDIEFFPNPVKEILQIKVNSNSAVRSVMVLNSRGDVLSKNIVSGDLIHLDVSMIPSGIAFVQLAFENGSKATRKVVIQ